METITSLLTQLPENKEQVERFSAMLFEEIESGNSDPLRIKVIQRCMEAVFKNVQEYLDEAALTEASKYGSKAFGFLGNSIEITEVGTKYDFSNCNFPALQELRNKENSIREEIKNTEQYLKSLKEKTEMIDDNTGEVFEVHPPLKVSKTSLRISIKENVNQ